MSSKYLLSLFLFLCTLGTIQSAAPASFACPEAVNLQVSNLTDSSATLQWDAVPGAVSYEIEVEDEQNIPSTFHLETNSTTNSYAITGLTAGVMYKFKVRTRCAGGDKSDWTEWFFFTATGGNGGGGNGPCTTPTGLNVSVSNDTITLNWTAVNGAIGYIIEVEDEQNNPSNFHLEVNSNTNSYVLTGLTAGVQYKFKVKSSCSNGNSDYSPWFFFTINGGNGGGNGPCTTPTGLNVSVSNDTITLSWNAVSGAVQYFLEVEDEQNNPSNFHLVDSSNTNSYVLTGLSNNVLYKFKVKTDCANGNSGWSGWHYFAGNGNNGGGGNGNSCGIPTGLSVQSLGPTSATLSWTAVSGALSYTVEIEREKKNAGPWQMTLSAATNNLDLTGLDPNTRYKFKVRTNCSPSQHSGWSKRLQFKTPSSLQDDGGEDRNEQSAPSVAPVEAMTLKVWPNPVRQTAQVAISLDAPRTVELRMLDLSGKVIYNESLQAPAGETTMAVPVQSLPAGLYLLQARHARELVTVKVVVQQ